MVDVVAAQTVAAFPLVELVRKDLTVALKVMVGSLTVALVVVVVAPSVLLVVLPLQQVVQEFLTLVQPTPVAAVAVLLTRQLEQVVVAVAVLEHGKGTQAPLEQQTLVAAAAAVVTTALQTGQEAREEAA